MTEWTEVSAWKVVGLGVRVLFACASVAAVAVLLAYLLFVALTY